MSRKDDLKQAISASEQPDSTTEAWDVFISHASEDKPFVRRLANALIEYGLKVWFDEFTLRVGDSLNRTINHGLVNSRYGIVVLSPHFFAKEWPQKELDGLTARESDGEKIVLPIWHKITADEVRRYSPILADRLAVSSDRGLEYVVEQLICVIGSPESLDSTRQPFEPEMILIPAGEFLMGSDPGKDRDASGNEQPQHTLYLPDYYIARTPVTNAQYLAFVQATFRHPPEHWEGGNPPQGQEDHPVVWVTWHDGIDYCRWLAQVTGKSYSLTSEAEWEKGARGADGRIYPWGDDWDATWCNTEEGGKGDTTRVGAYPQGASPYGLLDMGGNVWEWTRSLWGRDAGKPDFGYPYDPKDSRQVLSAGDNARRVVRGGSFHDTGNLARCAVRGRGSPSSGWGNFGFRVCVVAQ